METKAIFRRSSLTSGKKERVVKGRSFLRILPALDVLPTAEAGGFLGIISIKSGRRKDDMVGEFLEAMRELEREVEKIYPLINS